MSTLDRAKRADSYGGLHFKWGWPLFRGDMDDVMSMITRCSQ
jgi:hypothetical protein